MSFLGPEKIMEKRKEYFYPATSNFYKNPPQIVSGSMQYLFDENNKKYVDFMLECQL